MTTLCGFCLTLAAQPKVAGGGTQGIPPGAWMVLAVVSCFVLLTILGVLWSFAALWLRAALSGAPVSFFDIVAMRIRRSPIQQLVEARVRSRKAGLEIGMDMWEAHFLARGNVEPLLEAVIRAYQGRLTLADFTDRPPPAGFMEAAGLDLAQRIGEGKRMVEAVAEAVERRRLESN